MNRQVVAKRRVRSLGFALLITSLFMAVNPPVWADVNQVGDVGLSTNIGIVVFYIGHNGAGTLSVTDGTSFNAGYYPSYLGYNPGSTGVVTVDGSGSTWTIPSGQTGGIPSVTVGYYGSGTLSITNGGCRQQQHLATTHRLRGLIRRVWSALTAPVRPGRQLQSERRRQRRRNTLNHQ